MTAALAGPAGALTAPEREILRLFARGTQLAEIARLVRLPAEHVGQVLTRTCGLNRQRAAAVLTGGARPGAPVFRAPAAPPVVACLRAPVPGAPALTPAQRELLALVVEGLETQAIAGRLYTSHTRAKDQLGELYQVLGVDGRVPAVVAAFRHGYAAVDAGGADQPVLTRRQREVLDLCVEGLEVSEMAARLGLATASLRTHLSRLYELLGADNRAQAVAAAVRRGLVTAGPAGPPAAVPAEAAEELAALPEPTPDPEPELEAAVAVEQIPDVGDVDVVTMADLDLGTLPDLLARADASTNPRIRDLAARVEQALARLVAELDADTRLTQARSRVDELRAELAAAEQEMRKLAAGDPDPARTRKRVPGDELERNRAVRAWAAANNVECGASGRIPARVMNAWLAAQGRQS